MNGQLFRELGLLFNELEQNDDVRAVVLTGKGDRAFAAGADIKDMLNLNTREVLQFCQVSRNAFSKVESIPKPVIAAVNGLALGGGATQRLQRLIGQSKAKRIFKLDWIWKSHASATPMQAMTAKKACERL